MFEQQSLDIAALKSGVPVATARRWKAEAPVMVQQVQATVDSIQLAEDINPGDKVQMLASLADAYNKLMAASKRLMPETDKLAVVMDVLRRFSEFVANKKPALAGEFVELIEPFGEELGKAYG